MPAVIVAGVLSFHSKTLTAACSERGHGAPTAEAAACTPSSFMYSIYDANQ